MLLLVVFLLAGCKKYKEGCKEDYILNNGKCRKVVEQKEVLSKDVCKDNKELRDGKCYQTLTAKKVDVKVCDEGYTLSGDTCSKTITMNAKATYSCTSGTLSGSSCVQKVADTKALIYGYVCPAGTTRNNVECYYKYLRIEMEHYL